MFSMAIVYPFLTDTAFGMGGVQPAATRCAAEEVSEIHCARHHYTNSSRAAVHNGHIKSYFLNYQFCQV